MLLIMIMLGLLALCLVTLLYGTVNVEDNVTVNDTVTVTVAVNGNTNDIVNVNDNVKCD